MKAAASWEGFHHRILDGPHFWRPSSWAVLLQTEMDSVLVVVVEVILQQPPEVFLVEHQNVIEEVAADGTHDSFHSSVLPWRSVGDGLVHDPEGFEKAFQAGKDAIPVMNEVAGDLVERKSFPELLPKPFGCWVCGDVPVADDPSAIIQDDQDVERLEVPGGDHQEVHGGDHLSMVLGEGLPVLSGSDELVSLGSTARHEARDGAFGDTESQFQEFPVDPGCSPRGILCGHLEN